MDPKYLSKMISEDINHITPMEHTVEASLEVLADTIEKHNKNITLHRYASILDKSRTELAICKRQYHPAKHSNDEEDEDEDEEEELQDNSWVAQWSAWKYFMINIMPKKRQVGEFFGAIVTNVNRWPEMELWKAHRDQLRGGMGGNLIMTFQFGEDTAELLSAIDQLLEEHGSTSPRNAPSA